MVREGAVVPDGVGVIHCNREDLHIPRLGILASALPARLGRDATREEGSVGAGLAGLVEGGLGDGVRGGVEVELDLVADSGGEVPGGEFEGGFADEDFVDGGAAGVSGGVGGGLAVAGAGGGVGGGGAVLCSNHGVVGGGGAVVRGAVLRSSHGDEGKDGGGGEKHGE